MSSRHAIHLFFCYLFVFSVFAAAIGCGDDSTTAPFENGGGNTPPPSPPDSVTIVVRISGWDDLTGQGTSIEAPPAVGAIRFELSGRDIATQTRYTAPGGSFVEETFRTRTGAARRLMVFGLDAADQAIYHTTKFLSTADSLLNTSVIMISIVDSSPPAYAGLESVESISDSYVLLSWSPATDTSPNGDDVSYLIFMSTVSGDFDYTAPSFATNPGETSFLVTGLDPGTTYYFVVRAMDRAGNIESNTAQMAAVTSASDDAIHVNVATGVDNAACGSSGSPCKTITWALAKSNANQTIRVAKGTYNQASGETFPLQLKPGTALVGAGYWWHGIKVIKETYIAGPTPVILGGTGASIISCYIEPTAYGTSLNTVDDAGEPIDIFHCTVDGNRFPGVMGVLLGAASSLDATRVENFGVVAVGIHGSGGARVRDCTLVNNQTAVSVGASDTWVSGNVIDNCSSVGIGVGLVSNSIQDIVIFRNTISNTLGNGIQLTDATNVTIGYNSISYASGYGISINGQDELHTLSIHNNSITHGASAAVWMVGGDANINDNVFVCNIAGVLVRSTHTVDLRWNYWDHDPPTISSGRPSDPWCGGPYDICYEATYAGTPAPEYIPHRGTTSCIVGIVTMPPSPGTP